MSSRPISETLVEPAQCASERIRIPGTIQPYGVLLALDGPQYTIVQLAGGVRDLVETFNRSMLGRTLAELLPDHADALIAAMDRLPAEGSVFLSTLHLQTYRGPRALHAIAHRLGALVILELEEEVVGETRSFEQLYPDVRTLLHGLQGAESLQDLATIAARHVRMITGFDRVLVYRFDEDWNGVVVAEDSNGQLPSYLGHRFPASDIPAQARDLYRSNRLRIIPDANYVPVPVEPRDNPLTSEPLDLGCAVLRSVSPIHLEYMRNMGTGASMSISVLREGTLWGLLSCHSREPRRVAYPVRTACDFIGQVLSLQVAAQEKATESNQRIALRVLETRILARIAAADRMLDGLIASNDDFLALTGASAAAVMIDDRVTLIGATPSEQQVRAIGMVDADNSLSRLAKPFRRDDLAACIAALVPERAGADLAAGSQFA